MTHTHMHRDKESLETERMYESANMQFDIQNDLNTFCYLKNRCASDGWMQLVPLSELSSVQADISFQLKSHVIFATCRDIVYMRISSLFITLLSTSSSSFSNGKDISNICVIFQCFVLIVA